MTPHVEPLHATTAGPDRLGGKGASLARLAALGLRVPPGFVLPVELYRAQLDHPAVRAALDLPGPIRAAAVRAALLAEPLPADLLAEIRDRLAALGDVPLAVRSSAVAEDSGDHSFAGQHDTVLDVRGVEGCARAVQRCWASAWSDRAVAYRSAAGLDDGAAAMAGVVQALVRAEWAGVLFTRDPLALDPDGMIVEAVAGPGELLVSGRVTPSRWRLARADGAVLEHARAGSDLPPDALRALAGLGRALEQALGAPQDVEWVLAGGEVHVLQARPITTGAPDADPAADRTIWSNTNVGELLPEPATPMTAAIARRFIDELLGAFASRLGLDLRRLPLVGLVAGRLYVNMNAVVALLRRLPGTRRSTFTDLFGGDQAALREALEGLRDEDLPSAADVSLGRAARRLPAFLAWIAACAVRGQPGWVRSLGDAARALEAEDLRAVPDAAIPDRIDRLLGYLSGPGRIDGMAHALIGTGSAQALARVCRAWLHDADGAIFNRLLTGLGQVASAEAALDLYRLADRARAEGWADALRSAPDLAALRASAPASWSRALDAFLREHGHHARGELDVALPRWREQPELLLARLRAYLEVPPDRSPLARHARRAAEREALERQCRERLGWPGSALFAGLLSRAQQGVAVRELAKSESIRCVGAVRRLVLAAGERLAARGVVAAPADVFFLDLGELARALRPGAAPLADLVRRRRAAHAAAHLVDPPPVVVGRFDPRRHVAPAPPAARTLSGLSVSPGLAEGPARVLLTPDATEGVRPGEILVAPYTDPGWAPCFLTAAAIVMDLGGMLSHGAVVAREYGIPAVVNVGPATRIIRTGQRIRVDAWRGEVTLLEGATVGPSSRRAG